MTPLSIAGAGLAGLLAAHAWPTAEVFEALPEPRVTHKALLRFRSEVVAQLTGIEFRPVTVRKGIWYGGRFVAPDIHLANLYSFKCLGRYESERSIWKLDPSTRFIAPETLYEQLADAIGKRIHWGCPWDYVGGSPVVSTAPLPVVLRMLGLSAAELALNRAPIRVDRYRVHDANVYQTVYYPHPDTSVYRASITGDLLIVEHAAPAPEIGSDKLLAMTDVMESFGISTIDPIDSAEQKYGKIVPLPDAERKALLLKLTQEHGVYSLGRFATWRNILLDDVVSDIAVVRRLLRASRYDKQLMLS